MNETKKILIVLILYIILLSIDFFSKYKCCIKNHPKIVPELIIHRLASLFIYTGWIFNNKIVLIFYLIFIIGIVIHWITNNNICFLTEYENKVCNFPKNTRYDYIYRIFNPSTATIITILFNIFILITVFWKLIKY
jgi:hypothetical protein